MSSFLLRLGARAIGHAAIVPRAAALFETPAAAQVAAPASPDVVRVTPPVDGAIPQRSSVRAVDAEAPPREMTPPRAARSTERATLPTAASRLADAEPGVAQAPAFTPGSVARDAESERPRGAAPTDPIQRAPSVMLVRVTQASPATPALVAVHALPTPRVSASPRPDVAPPMRATESLEPVRVTIGRVEVRAVFDQAAARPAARLAMPSPSLDDYLRKRGRS